MRRQPKPWYRASKNAWFIDQDGKKIRLGAHPDGLPPPRKNKSGWDVPTSIQEAFYRLMASDPASLAKPDKITVAAIADLFLEFSHNNQKPESYALFRYYLESFCQAYPRVAAHEVKPLHLAKWVDKHPKWKASRRHAMAAVKRAFSYAVEMGVLETNPLSRVKLPPNNIRTRVLSKDEQTQILDAIRDSQFRQFIEAMLATGCRPSELIRLTASMVDLERGVWEFKDHKTAGKTGKARVVYLPPSMVELSRKLMEKFPEGPLFRGPKKDRPFSANSVRLRFVRLREKLPNVKHFVCYNLRHTYATQALVKGVGVAQVAELLGHTSTDVVSKTYGHLADQLVHMREAAKKAVE